MVTVLIVTYGERWIFLENVIKHLLKLSHSLKIVIVDNGATYDIGKSINILNRTNCIQIIGLKENMGSAYGFKAGLENILESKETEFIWFLDDDNVPQENCLAELLAYWHSINNPNKNEMQSLIPLRINRKYLVNVANGEPIEFNFPSNNAFLGFNLVRFPLYLINRFYIQAFKQKTTLARNVQIPFAPYGGLFMHKSLAERIGYPDVRFFLYADDFEYTNRITRYGGNILLLPQCKIMDIESVWHENARSKFFTSRYLGQNKIRSYFAIRNNVYFSIKFLCNSKSLFILNMLIYMISIFLLAIIRFKFNQYLIIIKAVKDGMCGNFETNNQFGTFFNKASQIY